jgi:hypothetical protein
LQPAISPRIVILAADDLQPFFPGYFIFVVRVPMVVPVEERAKKNGLTLLAPDQLTVDRQVKLVAVDPCAGADVPFGRWRFSDHHPIPENCVGLMPVKDRQVSSSTPRASYRAS